MKNRDIFKMVILIAVIAIYTIVMKNGGAEAKTVSSAALSLFIFGIIFYNLMLPTVLTKIAQTGRFIAHLEENGITFVSAGKAENGKFVRAVSGSRIFHIYNPEMKDSDPAKPNCEIVDSPPPESYEKGFRRWLIRKGYVWIGFFNYSSTLTITKTRQNPQPATNSSTRDLIIYEPKQVITYLRRDFVRPIWVHGIETDDGFEVDMALIAHVRVRRPYQLWFGKGGKAYETLETEFNIIVREIVETETLDSMYRGDSKTDIRDIKSKIADKLKEPETVKMFLENYGVEVESIEIIDWDDDAPKEFHDSIRAKTLQEQKRAALVAVQKTRQVVAEEEEKSVKAETEVAKALKEKNKELAEAIKKLAGDDATMRQHLTMLAELEDTDGFKTYLQSRALENTGITALGDTALGLLMQVKKQRELGKKSETEEKK